MPRGLSLVETIVIIGIIALLFVVGLPYFRSAQQNGAARGDAQTLLGDLRQANQLTLGEQVTYLIKLIDTSPPQYQLIKRLNSTDTVIKQHTLSSGVSWQHTSFTNNEIRFTTSSAAVEPGTITLNNTTNYTVTLTIPLSGYVYLH